MSARNNNQEKRRQQCQKETEQGQQEKGQTQAADAARAEPGNVRARRRQLALAKDQAGGVAVAATARAAVRDTEAWVPALVAAAVAVGKQDSNRTKGERRCQQEMEPAPREWGR